MQDFAKYKNISDLTTVETNIAEWTPDIPSVVMGILVGVFATIIGFKVSESHKSQVSLVETPVIEKAQEEPFVFDFYHALKAYEVPPRKF